MDVLLPQPVLVQVNERQFRLFEDFTYAWEHKGNQYKIVVPARFTTDVASVPRWAWPIISPTGLHTAAAVLHDFLYSINKPSGELRTGYYFTLVSGQWQDISHYCWLRTDCDRLFFRIMKEAGTPKWKRDIMFQAVRLFGGQGWN